jgi:hypothetical protein
MALVKDVIAHILLHVDAEASDSDPSQAPGVQERAKLVRDAVATLKDDARDLTLANTILAIRGDVPGDSRKASLLRALDNIGDGTRPQLALRAWVGQNNEAGLGER